MGCCGNWSVHKAGLSGTRGLAALEHAASREVGPLLCSGQRVPFLLAPVVWAGQRCPLWCLTWTHVRKHFGCEGQRGSGVTDSGLDSIIPICLLEAVSAEGLPRSQLAGVFCEVRKDCGVAGSCAQAPRLPLSDVCVGMVAMACRPACARGCPVTWGAWVQGELATLPCGPSTQLPGHI